jgi:hypothetical protein
MRAVAFVLLAVMFAFPQYLSERTYLVRAETALADNGWIHFCVLVYPDGKYRLEREKVNSNNKRKYNIYSGQLSEGSIKQLLATIDNPDFQALQTPWKHGGLVRNADVLRVTVPRLQQLQFISFETAHQRHPYEKTLKPFVNWMKQVEKEKGRELEGETANDCAAPLVFYRRSVPDPSQAAVPKN